MTFAQSDIFANDISAKWQVTVSPSIRSHLGRWLQINVASICPDKPSNPLLTANQLELVLPAWQAGLASGWLNWGGKALSQVMGKRNKLGEGERHKARWGGKVESLVSPAQKLG